MELRTVKINNIPFDVYFNDVAGEIEIVSIELPDSVNNIKYLLSKSVLHEIKFNLERMV